MDILKDTPLSQHFSLKEAIRSEKAVKLKVNNIPNMTILVTMEKTAACMERVRAALDNKPININSWYRNPEVNAAVGSKPTSQHTRGEAVDFVCPAFGTPLEICRKLIELKALIRYDQIILEHSWVHISFAITSRTNRGQVLSLLATGGYAAGLTDKLGKPYAAT
jgi:zinc D-Ala-D-Ala carboxypeptidase